jgi:thimet oligopeptidase
MRTSALRPLARVCLGLALSGPLVAAPQTIAEGAPPPCTTAEEAAESFARAWASIDAIVAVPDEERTFTNTVGTIDDIVASVFMETRWAAFLSSVHPDPEVRRAGEQAREELSNFFTEMFLRHDLYLAVEDYAEGRTEELGPVEERLLRELLRDFRRSGTTLEDEDRERYEELEKELIEVRNEFSDNIRDDESFISATREELPGLTDEMLAPLPREGDLYIIPTKGAYAAPVWTSCEDPTTRKKLSLAYGKRAGKKNVDVLERMIQLRHEKAQLLGYPTTAHYETEVKMVGDPDTVLAFYAELVPKLEAKAEQDLALLTAAKREHVGDPEAMIEPWDVSFYRNLLKKRDHSVDSEVVRQYFPFETVQEGVFRITQDLFGLEYREVTDESAARGRELWHEDVRLFDVYDNATGEKLGEFYIDLFPRPNKYSHAAQFPLVFRKRWSDDSVTTPVVALVCNFSKPREDRPSLMQHYEVETFFHEFGHCLHSILSESDYSWYAGTSVVRDFVEAPSQMLENWMWDADLLRTFARHYETGEPIPEELVQGMLAAKNITSGLDTQAQVYLGLMDMRFHSDEDGEVETTSVAKATYRETRPFETMENTHGQGSFGHLSGYQAGYYGYLWSLVYAQDMFTRFEETGLLDAETGRAYREGILAKGGTVDALELVRAYLGREPNSDAFLRHLGLEAER